MAKAHTVRCKYLSDGRCSNAFSLLCPSSPGQTGNGICSRSSPPASRPDFVFYAEAGVSIPKQLGRLLAVLSMLESVRISGNPCKEPPEAVVKKGMPAVSEYFVDLFAEGVAPVPRVMIKVVLVGQEGAGKTR